MASAGGDPEQLKYSLDGCFHDAIPGGVCAFTSPCHEHGFD